MMTPVVPTYAVTFTVKEFLIDPDNSFADTEIGVLQYMTVKIGSETKLTNASGQAVFNLEAGTHVYEIYDNDRYLTTVRGEVTVISSTESVMAKVYPCLYTPPQVWNMITPPVWAAGTYDEGWHVDYSGTIYVALLETSEEPGVGTDWEATDRYIPVATHENMNDWRTAGSRTMGQGTIFEGTFTTGLDKRYIQVANIDLSDYSNWKQIGNYETNITNRYSYNGNNLFITNLVSNNYGLFGTLSGCDIENIKIEGYVTGSIVALSAILVAATTASSNRPSRIRNCHVWGEVSSSNNYTGGICGQNNYPGSIIENCTNNANISGRAYTAGICGGAALHTYISGCENNGVITGTTNTAGICGYLVNYTEILNCTNNGNINSTSTGTVWVGGCTGHSRDYTVIKNCKNYGAVTCTGNYVGGVSASTRIGTLFEFNENHGDITAGAYVGGLMAYLYNTNSICRNSYNTGTIKGGTGTGGAVGIMVTSTPQLINSYSVGLVDSVSASSGGLVGVRSNGTITNSYYDSQTSGKSDTGKGLPRTTAQMKYGTASSFINPDGSTDATEDPANAMYTSWDDVDTWDFGTTSEYPTLK